MNNSVKSLRKRITPAMAQGILDDHCNYRKIAFNRMDAYADMMKMGKWKLSILLFDSDGKLCDGQHRLAAVVKSGVGCDFVCITDWPKDGIIAVDNGKARTRSQVLGAERNVHKNGNLIMALTTAIEYGLHQCGKVTNLLSIEAYDKHHALAEKVIAKYGGHFKSTPVLLAFSKAIMMNPDREDEILLTLYKSGNLMFDDPKMGGLRQFASYMTCRGNAAAGGRAARKDIYMRAARALDAFLKDEHLEKLYLPAKDPFEIKSAA